MLDWGGKIDSPLNFMIVMSRLDDYDVLSDGMREYLSVNGWHFSKKLCEWAVSKMRDRNGKKVQMKTKQEVKEMLNSYAIEIENDKGYDAVFLYHMATSDFLGSSIMDEVGCLKYAKDVIGDKDGYDGIAFSRFIADCNGKGEPIDWEEMI